MMAFDSLADFFAMGGYAFYVWTAYGISAVLIISNMWLALRGQQQVRGHIARQLRREQLLSEEQGE